MTVLEHVTPTPVARTFTPSPPTLRRKCACGGTPGPTGECEQCRKKRMGLQRQAASTGPAIAPPIVHDVLRSPGAPLDSATRAFMEPRFGHSFADVRVHTDSRAAQSAAAVGALAYTVGRDVAFASGRYSPGSTDGRRLLAHELAHVVQQDCSTHGTLSPRPEVGAADDPLEREADAAAASLDSPAAAVSPGARRFSAKRAGALQRKLSVVKPDEKADPTHKSNGEIIDGYVKTLCPAFSVTGGKVVPAGPVDNSMPKSSCECLSSMHKLSDVWKIEVNDSGWPETIEDSRKVIVPSPYSGVEFGAWGTGKTAHRIYQPNWLVLGHELCGHALPMALGTHMEGRKRHGGRPYHDPTVEAENTIAQEHGVPTAGLRGTFKDPHHGESFGRLRVDGFASGASEVPASAKPALEKAATLIDADRETKAEIVGHAHAEESKSGPQSLSYERANAVHKALKGRVQHKRQVKKATGVGSRECPAENDPAACARAEIFLYAYRGASIRHGAPVAGLQYGCFCGKGECADRKPVDELDECCKKHDDAYTALKISSGTPGPGEISMWSHEGLIRARNADLDIVRCAIKSRNDRLTMDLAGRATRAAAVVLYSQRTEHALKLQIEGADFSESVDK